MESSFAERLCVAGQRTAKSSSGQGGDLFFGRPRMAGETVQDRRPLQVCDHRSEQAKGGQREKRTNGEVRGKSETAAGRAHS